VPTLRQEPRGDVALVATPPGRSCPAGRVSGLAIARPSAERPARDRHNRFVLDLLPDSATTDGGVLAIGGCRTTDLATELGTPLVVYCAETIRARARAYLEAAPDDALVVYGTKAFPNVAILSLLSAEGVGADVSTLGELAFAEAAGVPSERLVFHGNNKSDEELVAAAEAGATVVVDALDEPARAASAGVQRVLVRLTPDIEAETHEAIRTAHEESKFGLAPSAAVQAIREGLELGLDVAGVHVHIGSQLARQEETRLAAERVAAFCTQARDEFGWKPAVADLGGGLGIPHVPGEQFPAIADWVEASVSAWHAAWPEPAQIVLEPGRSLVGQAGVTLYEVGVVKTSGDISYAAVDGGMSDNPRPQLYDARYTALLANRAGETPRGVYRVAGKHCESGDVLIDGVELPEPRRGDLLAVPATGAYSLALSSNYNGVPRPAVVLVANGKARLIRRRETVGDVLRYEE
jgi:diaminopimelate decarboxylase